MSLDDPHDLLGGTRAQSPPTLVAKAVASPGGADGDSSGARTKERDLTSQAMVWSDLIPTAARALRVRVGQTSVLEISGAPGRIRTHDLLIRSQTLYPTELPARNDPGRIAAVGSRAPRGEAGTHSHSGGCWQDRFRRRLRRASGRPRGPGPASWAGDGILRTAPLGVSSLPGG